MADATRKDQASIVAAASVCCTAAAGLAIGSVQSCLTAFTAVSPYRTVTPFVFAILALLWFGFGRRVSGLSGT